MSAPAKKQIALRALMYYLRRYVAQVRGRKSQLAAYYLKATGTKLHKGVLWRHLTLATEPPGSTLLVYLTFLHTAKAIRPAKPGAGLFRYSFPKLLKP